MIVDVVSFLLFVALVFLGWRSGATRQFFRLLAVIAVIVGVPFVSPLLRHLFFGEAGRASPGIEVFSMFLAGILIYLAVIAVGWMSVGVLRTVSTTLSFLDRSGGAALGAVKALVILYLLAALVVFLDGPLSEHDEDNRLMLQQGWLTGFVSENNVLAPWQFPDLNRIHNALEVGRIVEETGEYEVVRQEAEAADFLRDQRVRDLLDDDGFMERVEQENYPMTLADPRVREILNDSVLVEKLNAVDWPQLRQELDPESEGE